MSQDEAGREKLMPYDPRDDDGYDKPERDFDAIRKARIEDYEGPAISAQSPEGQASGNPAGTGKGQVIEGTRGAGDNAKPESQPDSGGGIMGKSGKAARQLITQSQLATFLSCRKKAEYRYVHGLASAAKAAPLWFGTMIHDHLEAYGHCIMAGTPYQPAEPSRLLAADELTLRLQAHAAIVGYMKQYPVGREQRDFQPVFVEKEFRLPLGDGVVLAGKIDGGVMHGGKFWLMEHKTATRISGDYIEQTEMSLQAHLYMLAAIGMGYDVAGVIYNIIAKPAFWRAEGETEAEFEARKAGMKQPNRARRKEADSDDAWLARCTEFYSQPDSFHRCFVAMSPRRLDMFRRDITMAIEDWQDAVARGRFTRNTQNCMSWNTRCPYWGLCSADADVSQATNYGLEVRPIHEELSKEVK